MKMRFAWYASGSAALAGAVVISAFHQRANFYSAMVHLSQSSLSLTVLVNFIFVVYGSFVYLVQRYSFGRIRPIEIEQLYEKAWFTVTETCLAMTIFRDEIGAFFLVMFTALMTGKVWGWIAEGRLEVLEREQDQVANLRLFHIRLSISLLISIIYDTWLLYYTVKTVVQEARPTMMVMFLFEFAILSVSTFQTAGRYLISMVEQHIIKVQTRQRLESRRSQIREQREAIIRRRTTGETIEGDDGELPEEDDVEEMDIEAPGWETKGLWVLTLHLIADMVKLAIYTAFFFVLMSFYGLPIHIIRDWFMTTRSFLKRANALIRYKNAVKEIAELPDGSAEALNRDNSCIICREEMYPWDPTDSTRVERSRPKKLTCGHIFHFGCIRVWLEQQQKCPICRHDFGAPWSPPARDGQNRDPQPAPNRQGVAGQMPGAQNYQGNNQPQNRNRGVRMFNLGPIRLGIAQGGVHEVREMAQRMGMPADVGEPPVAAPPAPQHGGDNPALAREQIRAHIQGAWQQLQNEVQQQQNSMMQLQNEAQLIQALNYVANELDRSRQFQPQHQQPQQHQQQQTYQQPQVQPGVAMPAPIASGMPPGQIPPPPAPPPYIQAMVPPMPPGPVLHQYTPFGNRPPASFSRHGGANYGDAIPAGSPELPEGVTIPPGWSLLPLQRLDGGAAPAEQVSQMSASQDGSQNSRQPRAHTVTAAPPNTDHGDRAAGADHRAHEAPQGARSQAASTPPLQSQPLHVPSVTAPTPIAPGRSGLLGLERADTPVRQEEPGEESSTASQMQINLTQNQLAENRGNPRAATVSEASSDSED